jgi:hypothetical protein
MLAAIDNWLFLLFIAIAGLFRLLTKAAGSTKQPPNDPDQSTFPRPDTEQAAPKPVSDEEQIRKFLEALGQPRTAKPPPPVSPRRDVAPRPVAPVSPPRTIIPPLPQRQQPVARTETSQSLPKPPPLPRRAYQPMSAPKMPPPALVPTFEVQVTGQRPPESDRPAKASASTVGVSPPIQQPADWTAFLRNPGNLQQAIILREIFGTPRSLQSLEDLPGSV